MIGDPNNQVAKVSWNEEFMRFELHILNKLKAYTQGTDANEHMAGKRELSLIAVEKGYTVIYEGEEDK